MRVAVLLGSALLSALVVTNALADGGRLHVGADTAGVFVAGVLVWRRVNVVVAVLAAAEVNAGLRGAGRTRWAAKLWRSRGRCSRPDERGAVVDDLLGLHHDVTAV